MAPSRGILGRGLASFLVATLVLLVQLLDVTTVTASFQLQKPSKIYDAAYHVSPRAGVPTRRSQRIEATLLSAQS